MSETRVLYRCTECGEESMSLGSIHGHAERHRGWHGLQLPWRFGNFDALMEFTEVVEITETVVHNVETDEIHKYVD